jgi:DnaK suppressor protein
MSDSSEKNGEERKNGGLDPEHIQTLKQFLLEKRADLVDHQATQLNALHSPDKHHLADLEEMASDTADTDSLCAMVDLGSSTLDQIDAALEKISEGTYGSCERCETLIPHDRIEALPFAPLCVECQRQEELNPPQ